MKFFDSHLHLSEYESTVSMLAFASTTEVLLMCVSIDRDSSGKTLRLAQANPLVTKAFVGVHPSEAENETGLEWLPGSLDLAAGVGEIGLDPKYSSITRGGPQSDKFEAQLEAAQRSGKPVQVHSRGAERATLDILGTFNLRSVLMHWFQSEELANEVRDRGFFTSFGPSIVFSKRLRRIALSMEASKVLSETDGPVQYEALAGAQGPSLIPSVIFSLAETWKVSFEEARGQVAANALAYLGVGEKG